MASIFKRGHIECTVNPRLGHETEIVGGPAQQSKKVMVIGGGPGGLMAACTAARRGHDVHLFEQALVLGGKLVVASIPKHKKELLDLIRFLSERIKKHGVDCHLGQCVTRATIADFNPDTVVLATGALPHLPAIDGIDNARVVSVDDSLKQTFGRRERIVIIGGGATGCEAALHMAQQGCNVTVVEQLNQLCHDLESSTKSVLMKKMEAYGVACFTGSQVSQITDQGVVLQDQNQSEGHLAAEHIVIATGGVANKKGLEQIGSLGYECHSIGDCVRPRSIKEALHEGAAVGRTL
jgi:pyruvate/2-oxoglutarate dehydrogenase complex dihydrolipoamide dehydrogenase (E3) component